MLNDKMVELVFIIITLVISRKVLLFPVSRKSSTHISIYNEVEVSRILSSVCVN